MNQYIAGRHSFDARDNGVLTGFSAATIAADTSVLIPIDCVDFTSIHVHVASGGSLVAAAKVLISDSYIPNPAFVQDETKAIVPGNWVDITAECVGIVAITGASAQDQIIIPQRTGTAGRIIATWLKLTIDQASGSGTVTIWWHGIKG